MKRLALYALILALVWIIPTERTDVAKLRPVEVISVYSTNDIVAIATDTGDFGIGRDALSALADMQRTSPAIIYLDTAQYLLIGKSAQKAAEELREELKPSVKVCITEGEIDLSSAAAYLDVHDRLPCLRSWRMCDLLPVLTTNNDRLIIKNYS